MVQNSDSLNAMNKYALSAHNESTVNSRESSNGRTLQGNNYDESGNNVAIRELKAVAQVSFEKRKRISQELHKQNPDHFPGLHALGMSSVQSNDAKLQSSVSPVSTLGEENIAPPTFTMRDRELIKQVTSRSMTSNCTRVVTENFSVPSAKRSAPLLQKTRQETLDIKRNIAAHSKKHAHMSGITSKPKLMRCKEGAILDKHAIKCHQEKPSYDVASGGDNKVKRHIQTLDSIPSTSTKPTAFCKVVKPHSGADRFPFKPQKKASINHHKQSTVKMKCPEKKGIPMKNSCKDKSEKELTDSESEGELRPVSRYKRIRLLSDSEESEMSVKVTQRKNSVNVKLPVPIVTIEVSDIIPDYKEVESLAGKMHYLDSSGNVDTKLHSEGLHLENFAATDEVSDNSKLQWSSKRTLNTSTNSDVLQVKKAFPSKQKRLLMTSGRSDGEVCESLVTSVEPHSDMRSTLLTSYDKSICGDSSCQDIAHDKYKMSANHDAFAARFKMLNKDSELIAGFKCAPINITKQRVTDDRHTSEVSSGKVEHKEADQKPSDRFLLDAQKVNLRQMNQARTFVKNGTVTKSNSHFPVLGNAGQSNACKGYTLDHVNCRLKGSSLKKLKSSCESTKTFTENKLVNVKKSEDNSQKLGSLEEQKDNSMKHMKINCDMRGLSSEQIHRQMKKQTVHHMQSPELKKQKRSYDCTSQSTLPSTSKKKFPTPKKLQDSHLCKIDGKQSNKLPFNMREVKFDAVRETGKQVDASKKIITTKEYSGCTDLNDDKQIASGKSLHITPTGSISCAKPGSGKRMQKPCDNILHCEHSKELSKKHMENSGKTNSEEFVHAALSNLSENVSKSSVSNIKRFIHTTGRSEEQHGSFLESESSLKLICPEKLHASSVKQSKISRWDMCQRPRKQEVSWTSCQQTQSSESKGLSYDRTCQSVDRASIFNTGKQIFATEKTLQNFHSHKSDDKYSNKLLLNAHEISVEGDAMQRDFKQTDVFEEVKATTELITDGKSTASVAFTAISPKRKHDTGEHSKKLSEDFAEVSRKNTGIEIIRTNFEKSKSAAGANVPPKDSKGVSSDVKQIVHTAHKSEASPPKLAYQKTLQANEDMHELPVPNKHKIKQTVCQQTQFPELKEPSYGTTCCQFNEFSPQNPSKSTFLTEKRLQSTQGISSRDVATQVWEGYFALKNNRTAIREQDSGCADLNHSIKQVVNNNQCTTVITSTSCTKVISQEKKTDSTSTCDKILFSEQNKVPCKRFPEIFEENTGNEHRLNSKAYRHAAEVNLPPKQSSLNSDVHKLGHMIDQPVEVPHGSEMKNVQIPGNSSKSTDPCRKRNDRVKSVTCNVPGGIPIEIIDVESDSSEDMFIVEERETNKSENLMQELNACVASACSVQSGADPSIEHALHEALYRLSRVRSTHGINLLRVLSAGGSEPRTQL